MSSLAAARADNFYYPPGWTPEMGSISKFQGSKGKNQYEQYGIIRFELPFDGWCLSCNQHLGKGLRFNAKKEKEGKYFTTQIYRFEMKCFNCSNPIVIKTDPKNNTYDYNTGIRKMEQDYVPDEEDHAIMVGEKNDGSSFEQTLEFKNNPINRLQSDVENQVKILSRKERIDKLIGVRKSLASKDADNNALLRKRNREKKRSIQNMYDEGQKLGLNGVPLMASEEQDRVKAKLVKYSTVSDQSKMKEKLKRVDIMNQSIFGTVSAKAISKDAKRLNAAKSSISKGVAMGIDPTKFRLNMSSGGKRG